MTKREQGEIFAIVVFVIVISVFSLNLPSHISLGRLVLYCAGLLLFQGLLRDLSIYLFKSSKKEQFQQKKSSAQCLCLESGIGILGIIIGLLLFFTLSIQFVAISQWQWVGILSGILIAGFLIKDWVFYWQPFRFERELNHANVIFSFKNNLKK